METVNVPSLGKVHFPDGMPPAEMEGAIKRLLVEQQGGKLDVSKPSSGTLPAPDMSPEAFWRERQRSATQDPNFQKAQAAIIPTIAAGASMIPGVGPLASAAISAGGTALNQALGQEPVSGTQIAISGGLPLVGAGLIKGGKAAIQELGKAFNPSATRRAATGAAMELTGAEPDVVRRANMVKPSATAFKAVEATAQEVPTNTMTRGITLSLNLMPKSNQPEEAVTYLRGLHVALDKEASLPYASISKELNGMYAKAQEFIAGNKTAAGHAILDARQAVIEELGKVSKDLPEAYALYKKENSIEKISKAFNAPRPDVRLGELLLKDKLVKSSIPQDTQELLMKIAQSAATTGTVASPYGGATAKIFNLLTFPVARAASSKTGQALLRETFKDGNVTLPRLHVVGQFMRAYEASGAPEK
jgi:hypothetical protein